MNGEPMTEATTEVLTVSQIAKRWQCASQSVLKKIHNGEISAFRVGKRSYRVPLSEVLRVEGKAA